MLDKIIRQFSFNTAQLRAAASNAKEKALIWSRGTGKSTYEAWEIKRAVKNMPRGCFTIAGRTFKQILTRTLPATIDGLSRLGWYKDVHYFIGRKPPKDWGCPEPYQPPLSYEHSIVFPNGTAFEFASQDRVGMNRGPNRDGILADEALTLLPDRFNQEILATNRGNRDRFGHVPFHHFVTYLSSMPFGTEGSWLLEKQIQSLTDKNVYYDEATFIENIDNLGWDFIKQMRRSMSDVMFLIEMMNKRMIAVENGFYPLLNLEIHSYVDNAVNYNYIDGLGYNFEKLSNEDSRMDADCDSSKPLEIVVDWGANINSLIACQEKWPEFRPLKNFWVKHPEILDKVFEKFVEYYRYHLNKTVYYWHDRNGNSRVGNSSLTFSQQGEQILRKAGWNVIRKTNNVTDPRHRDKYELWNRILKEGTLHDPRLPYFRANKHNCKELLVSMMRAPILDNGKGIEKDKRSERSTTIDQVQATHLSDAIDIIVFGKYSKATQPASGGGDVFMLNY